jgi:methyltransferase (TIGR00027 family)
MVCFDSATQRGLPSRTAIAAVTHRAVHQLLEKGCIFSDPLALRILGQDAEIVIREARERPSSRRMRLFIAVRSRFVEDALAAAVAGGVRQLVMLGAGLDTYPYRSPFGDRLRIFDVDHPGTQAWKRRQLAAAAIPPFRTLTYAPIDLEHQTLSEVLACAGFDLAQQTFFTWLGVVPYLTEEAVWRTLGFIASLPDGAHVVFDYADPPGSLPPEARARHIWRAEYVAAGGEPWLCYFEPAQLHARLKALGFTEIEDL